jgi:hypothetical protein
MVKHPQGSNKPLQALVAKEAETVDKREQILHDFLMAQKERSKTHSKYVV